MPDQSPSVFSILLDTLSAIFSFLVSINWSLRISQLLSICVLPFRLALYPLRFVASILLAVFATVFAPAIYLFSSFISAFQAFTAFLASLEPLYTFFGAAAGVGIIAGITLAIFSSMVTSRLGMQDDDYSPGPRSKERYLQDSQSRQDSSTDLDWQWLDSPSSRRKPAGGLLSQTIHEEDDSEF